MRLLTRFIILICLIVLVFATGFIVYNTIHDNCDDRDPLDGKLFHSSRQFAVGSGPNGIVMDSWSIRFTNGTYIWQQADVSTISSYVYDSSTGKVNDTTVSTNGVYDCRTGFLVWSGEPYK